MKRTAYAVFLMLLIVTMTLSVTSPTGAVSASQDNPPELATPPTVIHVPGDAATLEQAISTVPQGGIIELAAGTYTSPGSDGWVLNNINKRFTVRAATGANVVLSGGGNHRIFRYQNSDLNSVKPITFERITFANGYSAEQGLSGGITMYWAKATFIDCKFENNRLDNAVTTPGAAVYIAEQSTVFFFNTTWTGNNAKAGGGAIGVRSQSKVYIHQNQFLSNNNGSLYNSVGGAINLGNAMMRITNSRFDQNRAGLYGGAVYVIGNWTGLPRTTPQADVIIANSLFTNNAAVNDATTVGSMPTEGGAVNVEDQSLVRIYSSRFINNRAGIAGAVNNYRANIEIRGSVFLGNKAEDTRGSAGFGGSISVNSNDGEGDGTDNKPNATLLVDNSWLQGRYGNTTTSAISGGCLFAMGDGPRIEDDPVVPNQGSIADNQAQVTVRNSVLYDCDTHPSADGKGAFGAIYTVFTNFTLQNSIIAESTGTTSNSAGGGLTMIYNTTANISGTTFAKNSAQAYSGAVFIQGSHIASFTGSQLFQNSTGSGKDGAAIYSDSDNLRNINVTGKIENNTISNNSGNTAVIDLDQNVAGKPYNDLQYNGNTFYKGTQTNYEYWDVLSPNYRGNASVLNKIVVTRNNRGVNTDKSPSNNNSDASSIPVLGKILAAPSYTLSNRAVGEASNPVAKLGYAWSGASAELNGSSVSGNAGAADTTSAGTQTLDVGNKSFTTSVSARANPSATFGVTSSGSSSTLSWSVTSGTFLDSAIDQDVDTGGAKSGSATINDSVSNTYRLYIITEEGGYLASASNDSPVLSAPDSVTVVIGVKPSDRDGAVPIRNLGGGTLNWTATTQTSWIDLDTTSGSTTAFGYIKFNVTGDTLGTRSGQIVIQSNGGNKTVTVIAVVVDQVEKVYLPALSR